MEMRRVKGRIYEALMGSNDRLKTRSMLKILMMVEVSSTSAISGVKQLVILTKHWLLKENRINIHGRTYIYSRALGKHIVPPWKILVALILLGPSSHN
jgi:hypothetical protein